MNNVLKFLMCLTVITSITSCGYTSTEDDKHPDMSEFPEHSNNEITIKSLGMRIDTIYNSGDGKLLAAVDFIDGEVFNGQYIVKMDQNLNILDSIPTNNLYAFAQQGSFYVNDKSGAIVKYTNIKAKPIKIPMHPFNGKLFQENMENELKKNEAYALSKFPDSLHFDIVRKIDSISYHKAVDAFEKQVLSNLECIIMTNNGYIAIYGQNEYILNQRPSTWRDDLGDRKSPFEQVITFNECKRENMLTKDYTNNLTIYDKAVTGNGSSGGNHFVPGGFYPKGYQYYEFIINDKTTKFKSYAEYVLKQKISSRNIPNTNIYLLDEVKDSYYSRIPTYMATVSK